MTSKSGGHNNSSSSNGGGGGGGGGGLDSWRVYFRRANSDIFDIIERAIMVAASDCPKEFRVRRERIAELLFTCRLTRCLGCERVELAVSEVDDGNNDGDVKMVIKGVDQFDVNDDDDDHINGGGGSKGSKVNSSSRDDYDLGDGGEMDMMLNHESNFSYGDAEALTDKIEEDKELVEEVLRIKDLLTNSQDESDSIVFESLRRLQLMALNVDILKTTEIGKAVNGIKRHTSKDIRHLARSLIYGWKIIVDEWVKTSEQLAGVTPDSVHPSSVDEEEGLPSPPMDEGALFSTQTMDFSQFFDGMDDDGNPQNCGEFDNNQDVRERKPSVDKDSPKQRDGTPKQATPPTNSKVQQAKRQEPLSKPNSNTPNKSSNTPIKPSNTPNKPSNAQNRPSHMQSGPGRPVNPNGEIRVNKDSKVQQQKPQKPVVQRRPPPQPEKMRSSGEDGVEEKLEATKRKLQERYQQAENAKRQRTIQVMEIHDLPKQGHAKPNPFGKFGNQNRHWANGRR